MSKFTRHDFLESAVAPVFAPRNSTGSAGALGCSHYETCQRRECSRGVTDCAASFQTGTDTGSAWPQREPVVVIVVARPHR